VSLPSTDIDIESEMGAVISLNDDGTLRYDPTGSAEIQALGEGQTATDTFQYTISDGHGGASYATVTVELFGVDEPAPLFAGLLSGPDVDLL
jgi:VCBS repeat-containing protein